MKRNVETRKGDISVDDAGSRARTEIVLINAGTGRRVGTLRAPVMRCR